MSKRAINIIRSIHEGKKELVLSLISTTKKSDLEIADRVGKTCLHFAAEMGMSEVLIALLVDKGVDPNPRTLNGWTPLHHASYNSAVDSVRLLIENEARVNAFTNSHSTCLHFSAAKNCPAVTSILLENFATVNPLNNYNETPVDTTASLIKRDLLSLEDRAEVMTLLRNAGGVSGSEMQKRMVQVPQSFDVERGVA